MKKTGIQKPCVLIIEDEISVAELIFEILRESGMPVQIVTRFENVQTALAEFSPAVVFLDMNLGEHSGIEVLDLMAEAGTKAPTILMTGMDGSALEPVKNKAQQLQLTLAPSLGKPFEIEDVEACFQAALEQV